MRAHGPSGCVLSPGPSVPGAAPPAQPGHGPPDGYDDAAAVPEEPPAPHGGDAPAQPRGDTGYDDVDIGTLGTAP